MGTPLTRDALSRASARATELAARGLARAFPERMASALHAPIFFIGSGRSGTNLLARILRSHPALSVLPSEANDLWHPLLYPWAESTLDVAPTWADARAFAEASLDARTPADDMRLRAVFGAYQRLTRGDYFVNKSVLITFMIEHVLTIFEDARFIHLIRDGRSVALSFAEKEGKRIAMDPGRYRQYGLDLPFDELVLRFAENWRDQMGEIDRLRDPLSERLFEVRYEELCSAPERELRRFGDFLRIDPDLFTARDVPITSQNYKFERTLSPATQTAVVALLAPTLRRQGYPLVPRSA